MELILYTFSLLVVGGICALVLYVGYYVLIFAIPFILIAAGVKMLKDLFFRNP